MNENRFRIKNIQLFERMVTLRLPFRFGVVTLKKAPQAFVKVTLEDEDGNTAVGGSAELMVPKWFDKSPDLTNEDNFDQLRFSLNRAQTHYLNSNDVPRTAFDIHASSYQSLVDTKALNPLAASFGPAVIDKAIIDALCRLKRVSFSQAIQQNLVGIDLAVLAPDLQSVDSNEFLAGLQPQDTVYARHTVGLTDPLSASDLPDGPLIDDGLPETLTQAIEAYGLRYFKVKVMGNLTQDIGRLIKIAEILDKHCDDYTVTLDGNEQYNNESDVLDLWQSIISQDALRSFAKNIVLVEQPIKRTAALSHSIEALARKIPVIIDESDATVDAFLHAKLLGYTGVSSKSCKGVYKSIINSARCTQWNKDLAYDKYFMSAEDLTCQAGLAVQQDLALITLLGIPHVERNGHHYVNGMAGACDNEQQDFHNAHRDLYRIVKGRSCTKITDGQFSIASLQCVGFASTALPDWASMQDMKIPTHKITSEFKES